MANTRKSTKRAKQALKRQALNTVVRSSTKTAIKEVLQAVQTKDAAKTKEAYVEAIRALSKAASKGSIPKGRASRKVSRLTRMLQKTLPASLQANK